LRHHRLGRRSLGLPLRGTLLAVSTAILARASWASASRRCASSTLVSILARTWPAVTKSPSSTRISLTRPAILAATSISVASIRPLLLAKPSGSPSGLRDCHATKAAPAATAMIPILSNQFLLIFFLRCDPSTMPQSLRRELEA
jgi:hypothetical protein